MTAKRRARDERGAVFVFSVLILSVLMILASFVIDVGIDRIVRTDMQSLADTTALDISTVLDGSKTTSQILQSQEFEDVKRETLARNGRSTAVKVSASDVDVLFGMATSNGAWLREAEADEYPNAVQVSASGSSSIRLWPGSDPAKPTRSAIAARQPKAACITVGSFLAGLDTSNGGPLANLLNQVAPTSAQIFSGSGLLALNGLSVPLADLVAELHVADAAHPLAADVKLSELAHAAAAVLSKQPGSAATGAVLELNRLAGASVDAGINETIKLGEILQLGVGNSAAVLAGDINVFDLVTAPVFAFDGSHVVNIPATSINVPGFVVADVTATVVDPPRTVCGGVGSEIANSQLSLDVTLSVSLPRYRKCSVLGLLCGIGNLLTGLGNLLTGNWADDGTTLLGLRVSLGAVNARAKITSIESCEPRPDVQVQAATAVTTGSVTLDAVGGALHAQLDVPQVASSTQSHRFTQSPASWTHVGGLGTELIGPINLGSTLTDSQKTTAIVLSLATAGVDVGGQLTAGLNSALAGLGLSLNGATVSLSKMGTCNTFGLRK